MVYIKARKNTVVSVEPELPTKTQDLRKLGIQISEARPAGNDTTWFAKPRADEDLQMTNVVSVPAIEPQAMNQELFPPLNIVLFQLQCPTRLAHVTLSGAEEKDLVFWKPSVSYQK